MLQGNDGDDLLRAADGQPDQLDGGDGNDSAERDALLDQVSFVETIL